MTILCEESLEFAKEHIQKFYDSDFFPKPPEYEAIWHNWEEVKTELTSKNIHKLPLAQPRAFPAPKPAGDFRIVHQLEPLDALVYSAIAFKLSTAIENARPPKEQKTACSYRLAPESGNFFSGGSGYKDFIDKTEELAEKYEFIFVTDITDFYNQIYLHRLNNAIEFADKESKLLGDDLESFLTSLNDKKSQGIPVGPAASIVMAEAVLIDVDNIIQNNDLEHTRYVDDFRIFSNDQQKLKRVQQDLTLYLYQSHRLVLSGPKTDIQEANAYVSHKLHNPYAEEKTALFKNLEVFNPYTNQVEEIEEEIDDEHEILVSTITQIIYRILDHEWLDIGLARSAIRRAKKNSVHEVARPIIENLSLFSPVINDAVLYFEEITDDNFIQEFVDDFSAIVSTELIDIDMARFWIGWYLAGHQGYLADQGIRSFVINHADYVNRAKAARTRRDFAWVRQQQALFSALGSWDRRALIHASSILPGDERTHWLRHIENISNVPLDKWTAKWVRENTQQT